MNTFLKSWKTTLLGILAGLTGGTVDGWTMPDGQINWKSVLFALLIAGLGAMAKDKNVTGGTKPATVEAESRATGMASDPSSK